MKPVIIIPAFARPLALKRLLNSINNADYPSDDIQVIISLDGGALESVRSVAHGFSFHHGTVEVQEHEKNLGLHKHIIKCGEMSQLYGSVIILEDDLYVDRYFYIYTMNALSFYQNDQALCGISLYSYGYNPVAKLAFQPMYNGYTGYFMQVPSSWGQAWTEMQWCRFKEWYDKAPSDLFEQRTDLPGLLYHWPESSWKKWFYAYMIEYRLYVLYPYLSYTTNFSDPGGVHARDGTNQYQVVLGSQIRPTDQLSFCRFQGTAVLYDAFFESEARELYDDIGYSPDKIEIDFHGTKPLSLLRSKEFVLTSKKCKNPLAMFRLGMRPIEKTVLFPSTEISNDTLRYRDYIYLSESKNIVSEKRPFFEQVNYHSYYQTENKYFLRRYILNYLKNLIK